MTFSVSRSRRSLFRSANQSVNRSVKCILMKLLITIVQWETSRDTLSIKKNKPWIHVPWSFINDYFLPAFLIADDVLF